MPESWKKQKIQALIWYWPKIIEFIEGCDTNVSQLSREKIHGQETLLQKEFHRTVRWLVRVSRSSFS